MSRLTSAILEVVQAERMELTLQDLRFRVFGTKSVEMEMRRRQTAQRQRIQLMCHVQRTMWQTCSNRNREHARSQARAHERAIVRPWPGITSGSVE